MVEIALAGTAGAGLILQVDQLPWGWGQLAMFGPTIVILVLLLGFMIKMAPTWKELRMRELGVREEEARSGAQQATAMTAVASSLSTLGGHLSESSRLLGNVTIEQRRATDAVRILQRVNSETAENLRETVHELSERVGAIEERHAEKNSGSASH